MKRNNFYTELLYKKYNKLYLNKKEAASEFGISTCTFDRKIAEGYFQIFDRLGSNGSYRFSIKDVVEYMEANSAMSA